MGAEIICDGCGKRAAMVHWPRGAFGWHKPDAWYQRQDEDGPQLQVEQLRTLLRELAEALRELVQCNEEWNDAVSSVIGRPAGWNDSYLKQARAVLSRAEEILDAKP